MLLSKEAETGLDGTNIKRYEDLGYNIPRRINNWKECVEKGLKVIVKVEDLPHSSGALVDYQCDGCDGVFSVGWGTYLKCVHEDGKYYCNRCAQNGNKKWVSFYEWCYTNLLEEIANLIMSRWDYEKNIDKDGNVISPNDVTYSSAGLNKNGYWFKCLDHPEHMSEQKNINSFTSCRVGYNGSLDCKQCNVIGLTHPHLIKYFVNKEDAYKYSMGSSASVLMVCPDCKNPKLVSIKTLKARGFSCSKCGDGIPYSEKFMFNFLLQLEYICFKPQLTRKTFSWCKTRKYDFYINDIDCIVETHGKQHYEEVNGKDDKWNSNWGVLNKTQEIDKHKELLAKENGIKHYIILDCRKSTMEWIRNSIMNSELPELLNFKEEDIDWLKCEEYAISSIVKLICDTWNNGIENSLEIAEKTKYARCTVIKYLKQGSKIGLCNYDSKKESEKHLSLIYEKNRKKVLCITTGEVFNSIVEASNKYNINASNISACCRNIQIFAGKHPETREPMKWMYNNLF